MSKQQPKALRLADLLQLHGALPGSVSDESGNELRRLHAINAELVEALKACDEAMIYMSEYDIPLTLPSQVKDALAKAEGREA